MRIAVGLLASATVLFVTSTLGLVATWGVVSGVILAVASAVIAVVTMEERENLADDAHAETPYIAGIDHIL